MPYDIIIGGSGMLAPLCLDLARSGRHVFVLARSARKLNVLAGQHPNIIPLLCDYTDEKQFAESLTMAANAALKVDRIICWTHDDAPEAPYFVANQIPADFYHVLGIDNADPAQPQILHDYRLKFDAMSPRRSYRQIILGFVQENDGSTRWLKNDEICNGVKQVLQDPAPLSIIGAIEPWTQRPAKVSEKI